MAEYIKRDDALKAVTDCWEKDFGCRPAGDIIRSPYYAIFDIPAADVVDVVRCKDCINHRKSGLCEGWSRYGTITTPDDAYCSYGRKIDG